VDIGNWLGNDEVGYAGVYVNNAGGTRLEDFVGGSRV
jgi:hypothetical protein